MKKFLFLLALIVLVACGSEKPESVKLEANSQELVAMRAGDQVEIDLTVYGYDQKLRLELFSSGVFKKVSGPNAEITDEVVIEGLAPGVGTLKWDGTFLLSLILDGESYLVGTFAAPAEIFPAE